MLAFATADDGTRLFVRTHAGPTKLGSDARHPLRRHRVRRLHLEVSVGRARGDDARRALALPRPRPQRDARRSRAHRHRRARRRPRWRSDASSAIRRASSSGTRWAARSRSRSSASTPRDVRGLVLLCGSYGRVTKTFRGVPILEMILPKVIAAVKKNPTPSCARSGSASRRTSRSSSRSRRAISIPEHFHIEDMRPYVTHMRTSTSPHVPPDAHGGGRAQRGGSPADDRRARARRRGRARHVHAALPRRGDGQGDADGRALRREERQPRRAARAARARRATRFARSLRGLP